MARRASATATRRRGRAWTALAYMVALVPLAPAILVNVDTAHAGSLGWAFAAGLSIAMGAVFFECSLVAKGLFQRLGFLMLSVIIVLGNVQNAMINASATSDHRSDHRRNAIQSAQKASSQRSHWSQGRNEQAKVAGETPVAAIEAEIEAATLKESNRWRATDQCDPIKTTARDSRAFCASIAELKAKLAAAKVRDDLDKKIAALDAKREDMDDVPTVVDPFVENVMRILVVVGVVDTPELRSIISASKDWIKAILLEMMAVFGPSAILMLLLRREVEEPVAAVEKVQKAPSPPTQKPVQPVAEVEVDPSILAADDPLHAFIASELDEQVGATMPAGEVWMLWQAYCAENDMPIGTQRAFGSKLKKVIAWEANNNRPRYLNVRRKAKVKADLRVVASNG